jgi:hypothetical protein
MVMRIAADGLVQIALCSNPERIDHKGAPQPKPTAQWNLEPNFVDSKGVGWWS